MALDSQCPVCATAASAQYDDGLLSVTCELDHPLFVWTPPPNAAVSGDLDELVSVATTLAYHSYELVTDGICSECFSPVEQAVRTVDAGADGQSFRFTADCPTCGAHWDVPIGFALLGEPSIE